MKKIAFLLLCLTAFLLSTLSKAQEMMVPVEAHPDIDTMVFVRGKKLHARIHGKEKLGLVLINGYGASQNYWNNILPELKESFSVLTYDREGYGNSEIVAEKISILDSAEDLHRLLEVMGINHPVIIAAHSYGGLIARKFVQIYPKNAIALLLIDSSHELTKQRSLEILKGDDLELFKTFLNGSQAKYPFPGMKAERECMSESEKMLIDQPQLPQLPCIVLTAEERPPYRGFSDEGVQAIQELDWKLQKELGSRIPGTEHQIVKGAGHIIHLTHPEVVIKSIVSLYSDYLKLH